MFVGGGDNATLAYSEDGKSWTPVDSSKLSGFKNAYSLVWNGNLWIASGGYGDYTIAYSENAKDWTVVDNSKTFFNGCFSGASVAPLIKNPMT